MRTHEDAKAFAEDWIAAWNSHDLDRILSHYAPDIIFKSPIAAQIVGNGVVSGLSNLRAYWTLGLKANPNLKFELRDVFLGHECLTLLYQNHRGQSVTETVEFAPNGKVVRSAACYC